MKLRRLISREILHRRFSFVLGASAVCVAVFSFIAALASLERFDLNTESDLNALKVNMEKELSGLEDEIRKAMKGLGFNIHIYPKSQDLAVIYEQGYGNDTMPEEYVERLANSEIVTVNHLLPRLTQMVSWTEKEQTVLLLGVRGEVPIAFRGPNRKSALIDPVSEGKIVLGYELHHRHGLKVGDLIKFRGEEVEVADIHPRRGTVDDITVWMALPSVQRMLQKPGQINGILALECNCESIDRLGEVKAEIGRILPNTQIIEKESKALARAEARNEVKISRQKQQKEFLNGQSRLRNTQSRFANIIVPLVATLSMAWIAYLTVTNVRERSVEIGTLGAIGIGGWKLMWLILARALLMGVAGGIAAMILFVSLVPFFWGSAVFHELSSKPLNWIALLITPPLFSCAAAWIPALRGAERDPAIVLRNE